MSEEVEQLSKMDAARRQLNAAIRLFLASEDEVAIHTLGAAAYRICRDLKQIRGRTELTDLISGAAFNIAKQIAHGKLDDVPPGAESIREMIFSLVEGFKSGTLEEVSQVHIKAVYEKRHWHEFNAIANFLKHADKDDEAILSFAATKNVRLLDDATRSFVDLAGYITSEMAAFEIFLKPTWRVFANLLGTKAEELSMLDPAERRGRCLTILQELSAGRGT